MFCEHFFRVSRAPAVSPARVLKTPGVCVCTALCFIRTQFVRNKLSFSCTSVGGTKICLYTTIECLLPRQYKCRNILLWLQTLQLRCEQRTFVTAHMNKRDISKKNLSKIDFFWAGFPTVQNGGNRRRQRRRQEIRDECGREGGGGGPLSSSANNTQKKPTRGSQETPKNKPSLSGAPGLCPPSCSRRRH